MRAIKFRGKRVDNDEWAYGYLYYYQCKPRISNELFEAPAYHDPAGSWIYNEHEITPETVGQFTGLTDKNGVDIYEGDILKASKHSDGRPLIVTYGNDASFNAFPFGSAYSASLYSRIIGNIHDNPELLEGGVK